MVMDKEMMKLKEDLKKARITLRTEKLQKRVYTMLRDMPEEQFVRAERCREVPLEKKFAMYFVRTCSFESAKKMFGNERNTDGFAFSKRRTVCTTIKDGKSAWVTVDTKKLQSMDEVERSRYNECFESSLGNVKKGRYPHPIARKRIFKLCGKNRFLVVYYYNIEHRAKAWLMLNPGAVLPSTVVTKMAADKSELSGTDENGTESDAASRVADDDDAIRTPPSPSLSSSSSSSESDTDDDTARNPRKRPREDAQQVMSSPFKSHRDALFSVTDNVTFVYNGDVYSLPKHRLADAERFGFIPKTCVVKIRNRQ